jgi:hypothetical protein
MPSPSWAMRPSLQTRQPGQYRCHLLTNSYRIAKMRRQPGERALWCRNSSHGASPVDNFGYQPDHYITVSQVICQHGEYPGRIEITVPAWVDGTARHGGIQRVRRFTGVRRRYVRILQPDNQPEPDEVASSARTRSSMLCRPILSPENWLTCRH